MSSRKVFFPRKVEISNNDEDFFYDTLFERIRTVWPSLSSYEVEILEVTFIELGYVDAAYVASRLESQDLTAVSESYVFVQRWAVPNVWKWIITPELEEKGIPVKDFPLNYDPSHSDFKVLAWREKMDGVPYIMESNHLTGERQISGASVRVLVPSDLAWIVYAERVRDTFYVLYPYKDYVGQFESDGVVYTVKSHKWRSGRIENCKEGAILLTDRGEYRLKSFPTAEVKRGDQVWEVGLQGQKLINIRPRYTSKYRTEMDALSYLSRQPFLRMYDLYVEEQEEFSADVHYTVSRSLGDGITISGGKISESEEYANISRIYTSAKALIQDKYGRFLLIQEGSKMWDLPGGKCNFLSEPPSQILRRELKEELDWDIPWRILFFKNIRYTEGSVVFLYHFVVNPTSISPKSNIRWVTVEEYLSLSQREMVSWLPSLFTDIVTIDRHFSYYSEEKEYRIIQRCKPGTIVSCPLDESNMTDMAGNPVEFTDGKCRYIHPVVPGSGELWREVSKEIIAVARGNGATNDSDLTCPTGEVHHWLTHPEKRKFAHILQVFSKSDVFLYHEFMRNIHRLWGRRVSVGALSFVRSPDDHVTYVWTREFSHSWINFIYYEKAVTIQEIQAYFPEIKQSDLDQKVNAGILQVKRIGHWNYYTVV